MERESFEDNEVAKVLNKNFISPKGVSNAENINKVKYGEDYATGKNSRDELNPNFNG